MLNWFTEKGYFQGIFWMIMSCVVSNMNDILTKLAGSRLPGAEVAFFRFLFGALVLLPFMMALGSSAFKTKHPKVHMTRAVLLFLAIAPWCYGLAQLPLTLATTISFTTPFFILPLAKIFLKEHIGIHRCIATLLGFVGIFISLHPDGGTLNPLALLLVCSTVMFASLDIINKKLVTGNEGMLPMLFYSAIGTAILGAVPTWFVWVVPELNELFFLALLGVGSNLILFCLLKAFAATEVSALQPFRYAELVVSAAFGFVIFNELPTMSTLMGAAIIVPATFYIAYVETHKQIKLRKLKAA